MIQFDVKEGKLFVVSEGEIPKELSSAFFRLIDSWGKITIIKTPSENWEGIDFAKEKVVPVKDIKTNEEIGSTDVDLVKVNEAISVMWVVRNGENLEKVNEISERVGSLALIIGGDIEVNSDIKCLSLQINGKSDIGEQLKKIDLPLRRETWRLAREERMEQKKLKGSQTPTVYSNN